MARSSWIAASNLTLEGHVIVGIRQWVTLAHEALSEIQWLESQAKLVHATPVRESCHKEPCGYRGHVSMFSIRQCSSTIIPTLASFLCSVKFIAQTRYIKLSFLIIKYILLQTSWIKEVKLHLIINFRTTHEWNKIILVVLFSIIIIILWKPNNPLKYK